MNLSLYLIYYFLIILSIIGFGYSFQCLFLKKEKNHLGYFGIYGIFFLIIVSYLSNYFLPHDLIFNSILLVTGLSLFILYLKENYNSEKKNIKLILIIFLILSVQFFSKKSR